MVCEHITRQKTFPQRKDFCCSIWRQQLRKSLKHVDGFHKGVFLRTEIASRIHEHLYTCYNMPCRIWAALHSTLLCPFLGLISIQPYLVCSQGSVFLLLGLWNSIPPKLNVWWLEEGTVDALDFSLFASHSCAFSVKYSFLFLKRTFHLNLGHTWEADINECNLNFLRAGHLISCTDSKGATLCYAVARTGPREIMYRKIKMHQLTPLPLPLINDRSLSTEGSRLEEK